MILIESKVNCKKKDFVINLTSYKGIVLIITVRSADVNVYGNENKS